MYLLGDAQQWWKFIFTITNSSLNFNRAPARDQILPNKPPGDSQRINSGTGGGVLEISSAPPTPAQEIPIIGTLAVDSSEVRLVLANLAIKPGLAELTLSSAVQFFFSTHPPYINQRRTRVSSYLVVDGEPIVHSRPIRDGVERGCDGNASSSMVTASSRWQSSHLVRNASHYFTTVSHQLDSTVSIGACGYPHSMCRKSH